MAKPYDETGFTKPQNGDTYCREMISSLQPIVQAITGANYKDFQCIAYSEQPTYGTNYKVKVCTGMNKYIHLHFYKPPNERPLQINFIERGKQADDPLNDIYNIKHFNIS